MRILSIDTATPAASAAIVDGGRIHAECLLTGQKNHSQRLLQIIDRLFDWTGTARESIDRDRGDSAGVTVRDMDQVGGGRVAAPAHDQTGAVGPARVEK